MRVLITGGTGLIGRALADELVSAGDEVVVLSRTPEEARGMPGAVRVELWDALTTGDWAPLAGGPQCADAIVNLAGENIAGGRWTAERKRRIRESRLNAGRAIVEAIEGATRRPRVVIQASGAGYYGFHGDEEVTEESPAGSDFLGQFAVEWEASTSRVQEMGVRWVAIRTGIVLSPHGGALPQMVSRMRWFNAGRLGGGRQWFPWVHIDDEVGAIHFLLKNEAANGPFNLTAPYPVTNAEFSEHVRRELGRPFLIPVPGFALRLLFGEVASTLLQGQRAVPARLLALGYRFRFPDFAHALRNVVR